MNGKPIIFSSEMVRALLDGRKKQTRRVMKEQPDDFIHCVQTGRYHPTIVDKEGIEGPGEEVFGAWDDGGEWSLKAPYKPGDLLWVRETWSHTGQGVWKIADLYQALGEDIVYRADEENGSIGYFPSIHMPRWASRLTLRVTNVRAERLQDISENDARAEGATMRPKCNGCMSRYDGWSMDWSKVGKPSRFGVGGFLTENCISMGDPQGAFFSYWSESFGAESYDRNPWVWVYEFEVIRENIDRVTSTNPHQ